MTQDKGLYSGSQPEHSRDRGAGQSPLVEKTVETKRMYDGKIVQLDVVTVELPNGNRTMREVVRHPGAVAILAITDDNRVLFVKQFRKPLDRLIVEIPAGKLEPGEDAAEAAKRELQEETGRTGGRWVHLHDFFTSPGFADEKMHLYLAADLKVGEAAPDDDEFVEVIEANDVEIDHMITRGEICDAKTLTAIYWWRANGKGAKQEVSRY